MKKILASLTMLSAALGMVAQCPPITNGPGLPLSDMDSSILSGVVSGKTVGQKVSAKVALEGQPIYDQPEGDKVDYLRETVGFYVSGGRWAFGKTLNFSSIVYAEDDKAYIYNPFGGWVTNSYLECSIEGDKLVAKLPQPIYQQASAITGEPTDFFITLLYRAETDNGKLSYVMPEGDEMHEISFTIDGDKLHMDLDYDATPNQSGIYEYPEMMLGMVQGDGSWVTVGDCMQNYELNTLEKVVAPEDLELQDWVISSGGVSTQIQVGFDGDDVYVNNLSPYLADSFIKGKVEGDKITFETGQYVGTYSTNLIFLVGGWYDATGKYELLDELVFNYDRDQNTMKMDDGYFIAYSASKESLIYLSIYLDPLFKMMNPNPNPIPQAPIPVQFADYYDAYGYSVLVVTLPNLNVEDDLLYTDNMYYNVYIDGELFTFDAEDYKLSEDMTDIPYGFNGAGGILKVSETMRYLYFFFTGFDTIGLQMFNVVDGETFSSELITYNVIDGTVTGIGNSGIEDNYYEEYYSLSGVKKDNISKGFNIVKRTYGDGRVEIKKIMAQ